MYIFNFMHSAAQLLHCNSGEGGNNLCQKKPVVAKPVVAKSIRLSIQSPENHLFSFFFEWEEF